MQFIHNQAQLNIDESDVTLVLTHKNKIIQCISSSIEKHRGPLTAEEDVTKLIKILGSDDKALKSSINLVIRLQRLTFDKVKSTCTQFRVKNLTTLDKIKKLKHLISCQLEFKGIAEMTDLENAITEEAVTQRTL